jgi:methylenetetrahydrofolate dehydrogenase (NADP+)/methenyltetrahydrofolate cyclohydrolase
MKLLDGKQTALVLKDRIKETVDMLITNHKRVPHLAVILVGNNGASKTYVNAKVKACEYVGFKSSLIHFEETVSENELLAKIEELNADDTLDGFIVQLPLPTHIDEDKVLNLVNYKKDVDGFHPVNAGRMVLGLPAFLPATPKGIMELLKHYEVETRGKNCVILGRSNIVGRPMSILMSQKGVDSTVTITHSHTENLKEITRQADIIIAALGIPEFLKGDMVKEGVTVIDVGITRVKSETTKSGWKLLGDVAFDEVAPKASFITPVPGGVGPMTIVSLLTNTLQAYNHEIYK